MSTDLDDYSATLALARAAGVGRFGRAEQQASGEAEAQRHDSVANSRPISTNADDHSATLALARAAGVGRFGRAEQHPPGEDESRRQNRAADVSGTIDDHGSTLALVRAAGVGRFARAEQAASGRQADEAVDVAVSLVAPEVSLPSPVAPLSGDGAGNTVSTKARLSRQQYVVLEISQDGDAALSALETKMGMPFAADHQGSPYWFAAPSPAGGTLRAFSFMSAQRQGFADLVGDLGGPTLHLSVAPIEMRRFRLAGPGVSASIAGRGVPQLPLSLPRALRSALGRLQ